MINIQSIQQLHCSRVSIARWNLKEGGGKSLSYDVTLDTRKTFARLAFSLNS